MIRINKQGITFGYNNDEITWFWWWARQWHRFYSLIYDIEFDHFSQYWMHVGQVEQKLSVAKIQGFSFSDIIGSWVRQVYRTGIYVILYDVNVEAKPATFWRTIPDRDKTQLLSDFVVLKCKNYVEASRLVESIPRDFAAAKMFIDGEHSYSRQYD